MKKRNPLYSPGFSRSPLSDKGEPKDYVDRYGIHIDYCKPLIDISFDPLTNTLVENKDDIYHIWFKEPETNQQKFNRLFNVEDAKIIE